MSSLIPACPSVRPQDRDTWEDPEVEVKVSFRTSEHRTDACELEERFDFCILYIPFALFHYFSVLFCYFIVLFSSCYCFPFPSLHF
jgi:hypothetical protein